MTSRINTIISGSGAALPDQVISNKDLEKMVDTSDDWIVSRTGIRERRKLEEGLSSVDLAERASKQALDMAGLKAADLDMIICATVTPDYPSPSTSCLLQARLGAKNIAAMDLSAGCTGFIYALTVGNQFVSGGLYKNILVVGVEVLTRVTDWNDRSTCVLFGDGAGAVILQPTSENRGILNFILHSDGNGAELLKIPAGGSRIPASAESLHNRLHFIKMNGNEIFKFATRAVDDTLTKMLKKEDLTAGDLDYLFLHQANLRIIEHVRKKLKLPGDKVPINIDRYGNMSSATIPVALHQYMDAGKLRKNDLVAMVAFGAGLTWGGALIRW